MANNEHVAILKQGVKAWNRWRKEQAGVLPDLQGAKLNGAKLKQQHAAPTYTEQASTAPARSTRERGRIYSRDDIRRLYGMHRKGEFTGQEAEWRRIEYDIIAAGREGRVLNPDTVTK